MPPPTVAYPRVLAVGDRAATVELGSSLDLETVGRVRALDEKAAAMSLPGVLETVPTYAALLVIYDPHQTSFASISATFIEVATSLQTSLLPGRLIEISVRYDGEDLDEVALACGLNRDAVVEIHSSQEYSVLMLGFSPGFPYMGFVDPRLRVPRRSTPRTRVPRGAVAVAGVQTGIYPRSLPGGWNLLGHTGRQLFDAGAPAPSLLMPGDRVRFRPATAVEPATSLLSPAYSGGGVLVVEAGIQTTVQDAGRGGLRRLAVPGAGYADSFAARNANACVGNDLESPVIECCSAGLRLRFEQTAFVAVSGARVTWDLERSDLEGGRMPVPPGAAFRVRAGNTLSLTSFEAGSRAYVAISALHAPRLLGSASVDVGSGFLRPLQGGDRLGIGPFDADRAQRAPSPVATSQNAVRVILGPQQDHFDPQTIATFLSTSWLVGRDSDRVGARLDGPRLAHAGATEIVSDGMVPGCIQVPPDGRPIVMLSDCPTTGGYPKIACVIHDDIGMVAQAADGKTALRFEAVRIESL